MDDRPAGDYRRLTYRQEDGMVHYQGTRFHPRLGTDHQLLPAIDFIALLIPPIALRYEILSRSYGAASTTFRKKAGWIQDPPVKRPPPWAKPTSLAGPAGEGENDPIPPSPSDSKPAVSPPPADEPEDPFTRKRRRNWARLIARTWIEDLWSADHKSSYALQEIMCSRSFRKS